MLFPYHNEEEYRQHRFYKSIDRVNIGGLPFLPSATGLVTQMLDELISDSPDSAFERATLPKGIESKLAKVDWSCRDVLVGTLRSKEQLEVCLDHNFYYAPAERVEKHLPIRYIAIYQTINFFGKDAGIVHYGAVGNYRIASRMPCSGRSWGRSKRQRSLTNKRSNAVKPADFQKMKNRPACPEDNIFLCMAEFMTDVVRSRFPDAVFPEVQTGVSSPLPPGNHMPYHSESQQNRSGSGIYSHEAVRCTVYG